MRGKAIFAATSTVVVIAAIGFSSTSANAARPSPLDGYKKLVVIYEENHSFDNLYGLLGRVGHQKINGLSQADAGTTQVDQAGAPIGCLLQNDSEPRHDDNDRHLAGRHDIPDSSPLCSARHLAARRSTATSPPARRSRSTGTSGPRTRPARRPPSSLPTAS